MYDYGYNYDYGYTAESIADTTMASAGLLGLSMGIMIFSLILSLISIISYAKIFKKAGKPWWASIVPIYNTIVMIEIAKLPIWYILLFFVPIANIYALFKINIEIAKKFDKGVGFGVGMTLLSIIFMPLLAFSDNKYESDGNIEKNTNKEFDVNQVINSDNSNLNITSIGNNIPTMENVQVQPIDVTNIQVEEKTIETPISDVNQEMNSNINTIPTENNISTMESVPIEPVNMVNIQNVIEPQVNAFNVAPTNEVVDNQGNVNETTIETINEPIINNIEQPQINALEANVEPQNAFNMTPAGTKIENINIEPTIVSEDKLEVIENINDSVNLEKPTQLTNDIVEGKKICKNCGNELPEIVSICPNCGTDNE